MFRAFVAVAILLSATGQSAAANITSRHINQIIDIVFEDDPEPVITVGELSIGNQLPDTTAITPLPARVGRIVPAFVNHAYILLGDGRIAIIEPLNLHVVAIF